ncbi:MAG: hypothetical protein ACOX60_09120 [Massiliimalia sp.]
MEDLFSKIQEILGSKEGQEQLKNVAQMLGSSASAQDLPSASSSDSTQGGLDLSSLAALLGGQENTSSASSDSSHETDNPFSGIDINMLMQVQSMLSSMQEEDDNTRLLLALKPHFNPARQKKVDQAVKMLRLLSVLPMIQKSGLLGGLFGDGN